MRKLHLSLDALEVQSFHTTPSLRSRNGTVDAHETFESECVCDSDSDNCGSGTTGYTCGGCDTPGYTCEENCTGVEPIQTVIKINHADRAW
jgi:hypothetical protein